METCQKNKDNRANVQFHQTTGSQSNVVFVENLGDKINEQAAAFDLFKKCHYNNKKKCYTPSVQLAINEMENNLFTESEEPKSTSQVVADVFAQKTKNHFLQNGQPRSSELTDLDVEKRTNAELRLIINAKHAKMDELQQQLEETEAARIRDKEEMKKQHVEMNAKIELLLRRG
ncbi:hypothetical protein GUJ93_ZPchr0002g24523 [Zizania palustris]|uniref:Uncharacterized protein n=1 Tax=Zizania palustris TaxID=103762 RepID=A0A8J5SEH4_ZIZPA|nr:hypothetical protein GUJ93_ZPchr0002g24523 [Zizania palustris]